ncbi:hypothetical protein [Erythrobacter sp. THAF29]|uniref:hypothetical protein n=1 Tax=Erythrobacter sp. THAF29 TaxID=2587851 RepID=UPI0012683721|nr:hypothetical protein [Erythrobacter sp. THAF29]QFT76355.1 hypothetical protein FIU90_02250 [Erythrobacter sp. THAF29]
MRALSVFAPALAGLSLSGCVVGTVADVVTAPVRVGSKAVDLATTSQSEADEKRGREIRKREERLGKLERRYAKELRRCREGDRPKCNDARLTYAEIQEVLPTVPAEPEDAN